MVESDNIHNGHRNRMREKFLEEGADAFRDHELLEIILYYCVPRRDTNPLAHKLINTFGSFSAVLEAPVELLMECGLSRNAAVLIKLLPEVSRVYLDDKVGKNKIVTDENIGDKILAKFVGRINEAVLLMLLDSKGKELYCGIISKGSVNSSEIYIRKLVELAVKYNASTAVLAHNHPSGIALPSSKDIVTTKGVLQALRLVGVRLIDHIIVADNDYVSMAQSEAFCDIFY